MNDYEAANIVIESCTIKPTNENETHFKPLLLPKHLMLMTIKRSAFEESLKNMSLKDATFLDFEFKPAGFDKLLKIFANDRIGMVRLSSSTCPTKTCLIIVIYSKRAQQFKGFLPKDQGGITTVLQKNFKTEISDILKRYSIH